MKSYCRVCTCEENKCIPTVEDRDKAYEGFVRDYKKEEEWNELPLGKKEELNALIRLSQLDGGLVVTLE